MIIVWKIFFVYSFYTNSVVKLMTGMICMYECISKKEINNVYILHKVLFSTQHTTAY